MDTLTNEVLTWLKSSGANVAGVASVDRFEGAPKGHHPSDLLPGATSVVTFGVAILNRVLNWEDLLADSELVPPEHRKDVLQTYFYAQTGYVAVNNLLNSMALQLANLLESKGHLSLFFPATYGAEFAEFIRARVPSGWGLFSQRHAAVMAGLGEFGLNNVVVTPHHGPRIRFNSVITEAPLIPSPLLEKKACLGLKCSICVKSCPGAISLRSGFEHRAVWHVTPARTDQESCRLLSKTHYCLGRCIKVCPVGLKPRRKARIH